jgi:hypothetical protein
MHFFSTQVEFTFAGNLCATYLDVSCMTLKSLNDILEGISSKIKMS